jgi:hypothetical protein
LLLLFRLMISAGCRVPPNGKGGFITARKNVSHKNAPTHSREGGAGNQGTRTRQVTGSGTNRAAGCLPDAAIPPSGPLWGLWAERRRGKKGQQYPRQRRDAYNPAAFLFTASSSSPHPPRPTTIWQFLHPNTLVSKQGGWQNCATRFSCAPVAAGACPCAVSRQLCASDSASCNSSPFPFHDTSQWKRSSVAKGWCGGATRHRLFHR